MMKDEMKIDSKVEVLVDNMEDTFNKEFAAWPIRGVGFVRVNDPNVIEPPVWTNPDYRGPPKPRRKMGHPSTIGLLLCCSPCICIAYPCFVCIDKIRQKVKSD